MFLLRAADLDGDSLHLARAAEYVGYMDFVPNDLDPWRVVAYLSGSNLSARILSPPHVIS
jgi:hypothetical protein